MSELKGFAQPGPVITLAMPAPFPMAKVRQIALAAEVPLFQDFHATRLEDLQTILARETGKQIIRLFEPSPALLERLPELAVSLAGVYLPAGAVSGQVRRTLREVGVPLGILVSERRDLDRLEPGELPVLARSNEAGGFGGPLGTLVLLQVMKKYCPEPFLLEGALDLSGARAAIANGARGVVLGALTWGFPEMPEALARLTKTVKAHEIIRLAGQDGKTFSLACHPKPDVHALRNEMRRLAAFEWPAHLPERAVPAGQDVEFGRKAVADFGTLENFLQIARQNLTRDFSRAPEDAPEKPWTLNQGLKTFADELGIRFPVIQGPMARISDNAAFLSAVQRAGGMPVAAFASMPPEACRTLRQEWEQAGCQPGIGIIGLDLQMELVKRQLATLEGEKPPFVLVAAPQAELVEQLLKKGLRTLAHAPHLLLLADLYERGCRWFILEGNESGGHIGRLSSVVLWQVVLGEIKKRGWEKELRLVFAGGLATATGIGFLTSLVREYFPAGDLVWGIQLGTPYLATREVVDTGAMSRNYRNWVLNEERTLVTGETVGLRARQVATPFVGRILENEENALADGLALSERRETFETANLGNLARAAASREGDDGCFMAGESVALADRLISLEELHRELFRESSVPSRSMEGKISNIRQDADVSAPPTSEPIAIIGMGCVFPGSRNPVEYFENLLARRCFIRPMPEQRLESWLFYQADPAQPMATYSRIGACLGSMDFDPTVFRIPPRIAAAMDDCQKLALICARQALLDAGYLGDAPRPFDRERFGVMVGNSMGGPASVENLRGVHGHELARRLERRAEQAGCGELVKRMLADVCREHPTPDISEDSLPGELGSLIAGRVASVFDLHGPNFTIDAACGSGLAAVIASVHALRQKSIDLALAGAVDLQMDPGSFIKFAKVTALSARGSNPFDHRADGFVMGEGGGLIILKRLSDALRDGDKLYAIIRGVGQSSDGKGRGITAPNPEGQRRAIERAWSDAGRTFHDAAFLEAHGTGTRVGDEAELLGSAGLIPTHRRQQKIAVGSVKANIGHLKAAAGIAGLIKSVWIAHQRLIPPQANFEHFPETWKTGDLPFVVHVEPRKCPGASALVGVSSFGFGGTNHHLVLDEAPKNRVEKTFAMPSVLEAEVAIVAESRPKVAAVFPGQGSQYPGMMAAWRDEPIFAELLGKADQVFQAHQPGFGSLIDLIYPAATIEHETAENRLQNTLIAQPAILTVTGALWEILRQRGFSFDLLLGHSLGEYAALYAAGVMPFEQVIETVAIRAQYMTSLPAGDLGSMGVIALPGAEVEPVLKNAGGYVIVANFNSPRQTVISGQTQAVDAVIAHFSGKQILARRLHVSAAFHSNLVAGAIPQYRQKLLSMKFARPLLPIPSNVHGEWYPDSACTNSLDELKNRFVDLLTKQMVQSVDFIDQVERAYSAGVRLFIEVGPKNVLCRLIAEILGNRPHQCLPLDHPRQDSRKLLEQAQRACLEIASVEHAVELSGGHSGAGGLRASVLLSGAPEAGQPGTDSARSSLLGQGSGGVPGDAGEVAPDKDHARVAVGVEETVLEVIEEISGYPQSMIQPDLDLEADLGIDTLKIFEIAGRLKQRYPGLTGRKIDMSRLRTMRSIVALLKESEGAEKKTGLSTSRKLTEEAFSESSLRRHILESVRQTLDEKSYPNLPRRPGQTAIIRSSDHPDFDLALLRHFEKAGCSARFWIPDSQAIDVLENGKDPGDLGAADIYVHVIAKARFGRKTRKTFFRQEIMGLFLLCRQFGRRWKKMVILTDLGGDLQQAPFDPSGAGFLTGVIPAFCQAMEKDFPGLRVRGVDVPEFSPDQVERVLNLGLSEDGPPLIGLLPTPEISFQRVLPVQRVEPVDGLAGLKKTLTSESVVLVTGGGSGITANLALKLAAECKPRLVILGRAPERTELVREIRATGAEVWYLSCDLADGPMVDRTAELIRRRYPRIDVLIHGAGIEISRHLANKTPEEIEKVYRVKVAGIVNLLDAIKEENVGVVVSFSSVASLFGNPGQVDYAAANGFLNQFIGRGQARYLTIAWSAWDRIGMAARGPIHELLQANEVEFIPPEKGAAFFLEELQDFLELKTERHRTVAFFGRLGGGLQPGLRSFPTGRFLISPEQEPYLKDHAIKGRCVVPAVATLAHLAGLVIPRGKDAASPAWLHLHNVQFHAPVKLGVNEQAEMLLFRQGDDLEVRARVISEESEDHDRLHLSCRADVETPGQDLTRQWHEESVRLQLLLKREFADWPLERETVSGRDIYRILFHGRAFQVLDRLERWDARVLSAVPAARSVDFAPGLAEWPFLLEAALHAAGVMGLIQVSTRKFLLPSSIGQVYLHREALQQPAERRILVEFLGQRIDHSRGMELLLMKFHVLLVGPDGLPQLVLRDLTMVASQDEPDEKNMFFSVGVPHEIHGHSCFAVKFADADRLLDQPATLNEFLSLDEQGILAALSQPKRRREWLAGRMALKLLARNHLLASQQREVAVSQLEVFSEGQPPKVVFRGEGEPLVEAALETLFSSITHGADLALAVIGARPMGIDLERRRNLEETTVTEFLTSTERINLAAENVIALWTAKEAVAKALGIGFQLKEFSKIAVGEFGFNEPYQASLNEGTQTFQCVTFKDAERVATIAWEE